MQYFNGTDYDTLYPSVTIDNVNELRDNLNTTNINIKKIQETLKNVALKNETQGKTLLGEYPFNITVTNGNEQNLILSFDLSEAIGISFKFKNVTFKAAHLGSYLHINFNRSVELLNANDNSGLNYTIPTFECVFYFNYSFSGGMTGTVQHQVFGPAYPFKTSEEIAWIPFLNGENTFSLNFFMQDSDGTSITTTGSVEIYKLI